MPIPIDRTAVERQLAEALEINFLRYRQARSGLHCPAARIDSGPPGDEAVLPGEMREACQSEQDALIAYQTALRQFAEFVIHGKIPEDIKADDSLPQKLR
jgi:hypothetical protein